MLGLQERGQRGRGGWLRQPGGKSFGCYRRLQAGEKRGRAARSSWAGAKPGWEVVQAKHKPPLKTVAGAHAFGRGWQRWELSFCPACPLKYFWQDWEVQGNHFLLSVKRWWRRPASASWRRPRRGRRRGRASSRSRGSSSRSSAAASYRLSTLQERPKRANRLWKDHARPSYNIARLYLFAFVLVKCLYKIYD